MRQSQTAVGAALCRLVEQSQPPGARMFDDPVVGRLVDPVVAMMASSGAMRDGLVESIGRGVVGGIIMRTRYIDDVVAEGARGGIAQLVILGAGLDTRAFRLACLAETTVFEVDLPETQDAKRRKLKGVRSAARDVRFVPLDVTTDSLAAALAGAGWDSGRPSVFVAEGVTQYLPESAVRAMFQLIGRAAAGSVLVFTYVPLAVLAQASGGTWARGVLEGVETHEPWIFGIDPAALAGFLAGFGLDLVDEVGADDYRARYLTPRGRDLAVGDLERAALAVVVHASS